PIYFKEDDRHQSNSIWSLISLWQKLGTGQESALVSIADSVLSKFDKQDREVIAKFYQDK
ncbi:hypothetical protein STEG23_014898, partial [Scotinomys teguina]